MGSPGGVGFKTLKGKNCKKFKTIQPKMKELYKNALTAGKQYMD